MNHLTRRTIAEPETQESWLWGGNRSISLGDVTLILRRRLKLLWLPILLLLIPGLIVLASLRSQYTATSSIVVKPTNTVQNVADVQSLQTELEVATSEKLAREVIDEAKLADRPEFNSLLPDQRPSPLPFTLPTMRDITAMLPDYRSWLGLAPAANPAEADVVTAEVLPNFQNKLIVTPLGESRVLQIQFSSEDPAVAAQVANLVAQHYLTNQLDTKFEQKKVATTWLHQRIEDLRKNVNDLDRKAQEYRATHGIVQGRTSTLVSEQISSVSTELIAAQADAQTAGARLHEIEAALAQRGPRAVLEMLGAPTSQALLGREVEVRQREAELSSNYGPSHPQVVTVRQQLDVLTSKIRSEAENAVSAARSAAAVAQRRVSTLQTSLDALKTELARLNTAEVQMRALDKAADTDRALLDDFLKQLNAQQQISMEQPDAYILSGAVAPPLPSGPKRKIIAVGLAIVAFAAWILIVVVVELLESGIKSTDEVRSVLNATPLGLVPRISGGFGGGAAKARAVIDKPTSAYSEALRGIHTALQIEQHREGEGKTVMITSSVAKEGKSTMAVSLARQIARQGQRVLLIDADLRRPNVHTLIGERMLRPLDEAEAQENPAGSLIQQDAASGLHVIGAPRLSAMLHTMKQHAYMVRPNVMLQLLNGVRHLYDVILIDTPPVVPVADARALSTVVDHCVFVVQWNKTSPRVARYAIEQLHDAGANVTGVVVTRVETKKHALYGFGDSAISNRAAYRYYTS